jgi:hypothetical protein
MKKLLAVLGVAALSALALGANAFADPQSTEPRDADGNQTNQVDCGAPTADLTVGQVNAGGDPASGGYIEVCNDSADGVDLGRCRSSPGWRLAWCPPRQRRTE